MRKYSGKNIKAAINIYISGQALQAHVIIAIVAALVVQVGNEIA